MNCENCKHWSESCAMSIGCGPMEALCENENSPKRGKFTKETDWCCCWKGKCDPQ